MLLTDVTVEEDQIVDTEDWRVSSSISKGGKFHVLLHGEHLEEWPGRAGLRDKSRSR